MTTGDVIFSGSGNDNPAVMVLRGPFEQAKPRVLSEFRPGYSVYALAVSPNGRRLAAGTKGGLLRVHALETSDAPEPADALFEAFHLPAVFAAAFCTDDILATGGYDGRIKLWSVSQGEQVGEIEAHGSGVYALRRIGSLVLASVGGDGRLRVWDMDSLELRFESQPFALPRIHGLTGLDYSVDSGLLVHASHSGNLHVYDVRSDFKTRLVPAHRGGFCAVASGSDYVVTAGAADNTIKVWSPSLKETIAEFTTSAGALAVGWASERTIMVVSDDTSGQIMTISDGIVPGRRFTDFDLRTAIGLPEELMSVRRVTDGLRWRDGKVEEAKQLIGQPERRRELAVIVEELNRQGFSAEAALLLADAARAQGQLLGELESRLLVVEALSDSQAAAPSLYALADLLETLREPRLAEQYFEKALAVDDTHQDSRKRIDCLRADPIGELLPEKHVRADFMGKNIVHQEIKKSSILNVKFCWRVVITEVKAMPIDVHLDADEVASAVLSSLAGHVGEDSAGSLRQDCLYQGQCARAVTWVYVPAGADHPGIVFALEIHSNSRGTDIVPYGIFDPNLLGISSAATPREHNERVRNAWTKYTEHPESRRWLTGAHTLVQGPVAAVAGQALIVGDEF